MGGEAVISKLKGSSSGDQTPSSAHDFLEVVLSTVLSDLVDVIGPSAFTPVDR
jgi:hypothetical protein